MLHKAGVASISRLLSRAVSCIRSISTSTLSFISFLLFLYRSTDLTREYFAAFEMPGWKETMNPGLYEILALSMTDRKFSTN